jgi:hypothetical protein
MSGSRWRVFLCGGARGSEWSVALDGSCRNLGGCEWRRILMNRGRALRRGG